jgi:hypothetical protein
MKLLDAETIQALAQVSLRSDTGVARDLVDNLCFVDYLGRFRARDPSTGDLFVRRDVREMFYASHRDITQHNRSIHEGCEKVHRKYVWLANYHNFGILRAAADDAGWDVTELLIQAVPREETDRFELVQPADGRP